MPAAAAASPYVRAFLEGAKLEDVSVSRVRVPGAPLDMLYVTRGRAESRPYAERDGRLLLLRTRDGTLDVALTQKTNAMVAWILAPPDGKGADACGGHDAFRDLTTHDGAVHVSRFNADGTAHLNCLTILKWDRRRKAFLATEAPVADSGMGAQVGMARLEELREANRLWRAGERDGAVAIWENHVGAYRNGPFAAAGNPVEAMNNLGFARAEQHQYGEAEVLLHEVTTMDPKRAVAWLNLGDVYRDTGRPTDARAAYLRFQGLARDRAQRKVARERLAGVDAAPSSKVPSAGK